MFIFEAGAYYGYNTNKIIATVKAVVGLHE